MQIWSLTSRSSNSRAGDGKETTVVKAMADAARTFEGPSEVLLGSVS